MWQRQNKNSQAQSGYLAEDTIAAVSTAIGGAISIVRISGPDAFSILKKLSKDPIEVSSNFRKLHRIQIVGDTILDEGLFVQFKAPHSYTGEDLVELHLHGGGYTTYQVLKTILKLGARQSLPGEFSFRAVRNGKMTIFQAQSVADLISASNDQAVSLAIEKMSGLQNKLFYDLKEGLRKLAMLGELGIDFADQDISEVSLPNLKNELKPLVQILEKLYLSYDRGFRMQEGIKVAFVGLPNAGKSSFFNALLGEERSIVSDIAGTTRDIVGEKLTLKGKQGSSITLRLEDTAGLRSTTDTIETKGIEKTLQSIQRAELVLFLIDVTSDVQAVLEQWRNLALNPSKVIGVFTKMDQVQDTELNRFKINFEPLGIQNWAKTSVLKNTGIEQAVDLIVDFCNQLIHREKGEILLTQLEQRASVEASLAHLQRAEEVSEVDLFAADVRQALNSLSPLIGETLPDDILGQIFSNFCIGK